MTSPRNMVTVLNLGRSGIFLSLLGSNTAECQGAKGDNLSCVNGGVRQAGESGKAEEDLLDQR